ncbi:MAG: hypothetical protein AAFW76_08085 [Pseudomonadota bacterium]
MQRQQLLILYLYRSALDSRVVGWSRYDGASQTDPVAGEEDEPPYGTALAAMRDGWRVLQMSEITPQQTELDYEPGYMAFEVVMEKLVDV